MELSLKQVDREMCVRELDEINEVSSRYGLTLSRGDMAAVLDSRDEALKDAGRVEFGTGVVAKLVYALCDSPYIQREDYVDTLCRMQSLFYRFKAQTSERASDDEVIAYMVKKYNSDCRGCVELLEDYCSGKAEK